MPHENYERRRAGALTLGAGLVSALGVGALAFTATSAAFTGTTDSTGDFTAAKVSLIDDDFTTAGWTATGLVPGIAASDCIQVEYTGDVDDLEPLRLYGALSGVLAADLNVVVEHGAAGSTCDAPGALTEVYNGPAADLPADYDAAAAGVELDTTDTTAAYVLSVEIDQDADNDAQGANGTAMFTWEVQSG